MKLATGSINSKRSILLGVLTVLMFGILSPLLSVTTVIAAPPDSLTVNGTDCKLVMSSTATKNLSPSDFATYNITALPQSVMDGIDANPEIKADYEYYANGTALTVPAILYDAVVAGNGDPQTKCREAPSVMYMSPSNPTKFFGTQIGNEILLTGTLNVAAKTFTFDATNDGTYKIGGDLSNPIFQQTTTSVGFCAVEAQVGPGVYASCMQPNVVDFNTISWRGEKYILQSWSGNQTTRMEYVLDKTTSPYPNRKNSTCTTQPMFRIDGDNADSIEELTTDGDNGISGFFGQLGTLATLSGSQTIQYRDYDGLCSPIHEGDDDDIELFNAQNFLRLAQYFAKDNAVAIIPKNPGGGEKSMSQVYTKSATDPTLFVAPEGAKSGDCALTAESSTIKFTSDPSTGSGAYLDAYWSFPDPDNSCSPLGANIKVKFTPADSAETIDQAANGGTDGGTDTAAVPEKTCSSEGGGLGWIVCPVLTVLDEATQWLENQIRGFLFVEPEQFNKDGAGAGLYKSWSTFRGLATIIIVIIALMMIFSQAMGEGVFNNYSVKKLLPRLIIAGIGIQLSWFLITELINIFNILGNGISGLIMSPFTYVNDGGATTSLTVDTNLRDILPTSSVGGQGAMAGIVIAGGIALVGAAGALAIGAAAAVFVGFITLIVRNIIIFLGVIFAPAAIAMSVLPGTQKTAKWWWESLSKALMMYPIVMVLFAAGKIVSNILMTSGPADAGLDAVTTIAAIAAWYAPYFFLPKALQAGGSALGKVTGLAGDKSKGMFDKARGFNDNYKKNQKARRTRDAFNVPEDAGRFKRMRAAGSRTGAYIGAGAIGRGTSYERGNLRVKGAQEGAQRRLFDEQTALTELQVKEDQTASERAFTNASIDSMTSQNMADSGLGGVANPKHQRQILYSRLARLQDGEQVTINGTTFKGSWAVRENAMKQMLGAKMVDSVIDPSTDARFAGTQTSLSYIDPRTGARSGVMADQMGGSEDLQKSRNSFINGNFSNVKNLMPDEIGAAPLAPGATPTPHDFFALGADKIPELDDVRLAAWHQQVKTAVSTADADGVANLMRQVNDLAKRGAPKKVTDELLRQVESVSPTMAADIDAVISSKGNKTFDPATGAVV